MSDEPIESQKFGTTRRIVYAWIVTIPGGAVFGAILYKALAHVLT